MSQTGSDARHTAVVSLGQASTMLAGGVIALLIAHIFGKSARTDAFFAAYGVATVMIIFGQTFRFTALPKLVAPGDESASARLLAAVGLIALAAAVPMVLLAEPLGSLIVKHDPGNVAVHALRLLWIAVAGQLVASMLAAILAVRGKFMVIGGAYVISSVVGIVAFLALEGPLGIQGVSVGLDIAAVGLAAMLGTALARDGWRLSGAPSVGARPVLGEVWQLAVASATYVAMNFGYVICVAVASRVGPGEATLYAYAYFTAAILVAVTAASAAMVRTPRLLADVRSPELMAESTVATYRVTLVVVVPLLGLVALVGQPILAFVLGDSFDHADTVRLVVTMLCLSGWLLGTAAGLFAVIELLAQKRLGELALIAVLQIVAIAVLALAGRELWGIRGIALGQSIAMLGATAVQLRLAFGSRWLPLAGRLGAMTARAVAVMALAFAPSVALVLALGYTAPVVVPAALLAILLATGLTRLAWPREWELLGSAARRTAAATS